jgi:hypothetical protein
VTSTDAIGILLHRGVAALQARGWHFPIVVDTHDSTGASARHVLASSDDVPALDVIAPAFLTFRDASARSAYGDLHHAAGVVDLRIAGDP